MNAIEKIDELITNIEAVTNCDPSIDHIGPVADIKLVLTPILKRLKEIRDDLKNN